jgi:hypothetical protein
MVTEPLDGHRKFDGLAKGIARSPSVSNWRLVDDS